MTNYNERLDEILSNFRQSSLIVNANNSLGAGEKGREAFIQSLDEAKQALRTLFQGALDEVLGKNVVYSKAVNNHLALQRQRAMVKLNEMFGEEK